MVYFCAFARSEIFQKTPGNEGWVVGNFIQASMGWWDLTEISPWFLLDSKSRRDRGEICSISPRLPRTRRDLAEIVEISPWRSWNSKSRRDRGKISSISPRFVETSPWCLKNQQISWRDLSDLAMIFVGFSNLAEFAARFSTSHRDWRDLAVKFDSFCILPRFWKTQTSYRDCQNITQSFPGGMNNFPSWI